MGFSFLTPLFLTGFAILAVPVAIHLMRRHEGRQRPFPSLMFLRRLPVPSVRRRRIRDWPLLLLRAVALAMIVLAFARPWVQVGTGEAGTPQDGIREVVIVLDRSWSMNRGERWTHAVDAAHQVLDDLSTPDRASLVLFDRTGQVVVPPTLDFQRIRTVLDTVQPGWAGGRIGSGLQASRSILEVSDRSGRDVVLISDFQRRSWGDGPHERMPAGTRLRTVDVGDDGLGSMIVADVTFQYTVLDGAQRVQPTARVIRHTGEAPDRARVSLEVNGQVIEARDLDLSMTGATPVAFSPITLPEAGLIGAIRLAPEGEPAHEPHRFVASSREVLSVLLVDGGLAGGVYLRNALAVPGQPPIRLVSQPTFAPADLEGIDVVVLNDVPLPSGPDAERLRQHVSSGGGLLVVAGPGSRPDTWEAAWSQILPGHPSSTVDRDPARGGSLTRVDRDHPIFSAFVGSTGSPIGTPRFYRYRDTELAAEGQGLAYFDDGIPALAIREVGAGRTLLWTSAFDTSWTNITLHSTFVPLARRMIAYGAGQRDRAPYFTVGQTMHPRALVSHVLGEGEPAVLVAPSGTGTDLPGHGTPIQIETPGFYEIRGTAGSAPTLATFAVNPDVGEADPARLDPDLVAMAVAPPPGNAYDGSEEDVGMALASRGQADGRADGERRQNAWQFLLLAALLLLVTETYLAGRTPPLTGAGPSSMDPPNRRPVR